MKQAIILPALFWAIAQAQPTAPVKADFNPYGFDIRNFRGKYISVWEYRRFPEISGNKWHCQSYDGMVNEYIFLPLFITSGDIIYFPKSDTYLIVMNKI